MVYRTSGYDHSKARYNFRVRDFIGDSYLPEVSMAFRIVWVVVSTHGAIDWAKVIFGLFQGFLNLVRECLLLIWQLFRDLNLPVTVASQLDKVYLNWLNCKTYEELDNPTVSCIIDKWRTLENFILNIECSHIECLQAGSAGASTEGGRSLDGFDKF